MKWASLATWPIASFSWTPGEVWKKVRLSSSLRLQKTTAPVTSSRGFYTEGETYNETLVPMLFVDLTRPCYVAFQLGTRLCPDRPGDRRAWRAEDRLHPGAPRNN